MTKYLHIIAENDSKNIIPNIDRFGLEQIMLIQNISKAKKLKEILDKIC